MSALEQHRKDDTFSSETKSEEPAGNAGAGTAARDEIKEDVKEILSPTRSENNYSELYIDGPATRAMLLREIKNAKHFIHVQVMLFYSDDAGFEIARALTERAEEGVEVRVMSDSEMSFVVRAMEKFRSSGKSSFSDLKELFSQSEVKFVASDEESYAFYNWKEKREELGKKGVPEEFLLMQDVIEKGIDSNIDVFDHRKLIVFDGETGVVTGANIGDKYLYKTPPSGNDKDEGKKWHDGAVLFKGPFVSVLNRQFASKWMVRGGDVFDYRLHYRTKADYGSDSCTLFSYFPGMEENLMRNWYFDRIENCTGRFIIENPYINDEEFWKRLSELKKSQAEKIVLINPYKAKGNDYVQNESSIKCRMFEPFRLGVTFYAYQERMTHWKIALDVAASKVFLGSYNLNHRSAHHDFEMNVLVESSELSYKVLEMLEQDMADSTKITNGEEFHESPKLHPSCLLLDVTEYFE